MLRMITVAAFTLWVSAAAAIAQSTVPMDSARVRFLGADEQDRASSVAGAGDVNGDGFDDLLLGSALAGVAASGPQPGVAYLVYGEPNAGAEVDLDALSLGVRIEAGSLGGELGHAVAGLGDVNGDGFADIAVSAPSAVYVDEFGDPQGSGVVAIIYGSDALPPVIDISALGSAGVIITGPDATTFGASLSGAGDWNNDGSPDVLIGVPTAESLLPANFSHRNGGAYVVYGGAALPDVIHLATIDNGEATFLGMSKIFYDEIGASVANLGDVNEDGIDDVILGAPGSRPNATDSGAAAVFYGRANPDDIVGFAPSEGVVLHGERKGDELGAAVGCGGDFNHDGIPDLMVGIPGGDGQHDHGGHGHHLGHGTGQALIVFGGASLPSEIDLAQPLPPSTMLHGFVKNGRLGSSVACIDDFNLDGISDVIVGGPEHSPNHVSDAGEVFVVYGSETPDSDVGLSSLGGRGVRIQHNSAEALGGSALSGVGDFNGDGRGDFVIAASDDSPLSRSRAGAFYLFEGAATPPLRTLVCATNLLDHNFHWDSDGVEYDEIRVVRNGQTIAVLPGDETTFSDGTRNWRLDYEFIGVLNGVESQPLTCRIYPTIVPHQSVACRVIDGVVDISWVQAHPDSSIHSKITRNLHQGVADETIYVPEGVFGGQDDPGPGTYEYHVFALGVGLAVFSPPCTVIVPEAPSEAACVADGCDVELSWTNGGLYTSVKIYRDGELAAVLSDGTASSYIDRGAEPGEHAYEIQGCVDDFQSARAECATAVLGPVADLAVSAVGGEVSLSWIPPLGDRITVDRNGVEIAELAGDATDHVDSGVAAGLYEYSVRSHSGDTLGKVTRVTVEVLEPIEGLSACTHGRRVSVFWTLGGFYDSIEVWRDDVLIARLPGASEELIDTVPGPGTYEYVVVGLLGSSSTTALAHVTEVVPEPVTDLMLVLGAEALTTSWTNPGGYDWIEVTINGAEQDLLPGDATSAEFPVELLGAASVEVRGVIEASDCMSFSEATIETETLIGVPEGFTCRGTAPRIQLQWEPGGGFDSFRIERNGDVIATIPGDRVSYNDTVTRDRIYDYSIFGIVNGVDSLPAMCRAKVFSPDNLACETDGDSVRLTWTTWVGANTTFVERNGSTIAILRKGAESFVDTDPPVGDHTYGIRWAYRVTAGFAKTCEVSVLPPVTDMTCLANGNTVSLAWANGGAYDTIKIFRNGAEITPVGGIDGTATTYADNDVSPGSYCYVVQGFTAAGGVSPLSEECCTDVLLFPIRLSCIAEDAITTLSWTNPREYDEIEILRDGNVIASLPGTGAIFVDDAQALVPGSYSYEVRGKSGTSVSASATCPVVIAGEVTGFSCVQQHDALHLSWTAPGDADAISVTRNGELVATVPGSASSFVDSDLEAGSYSYELRTGNAGDFGAAVGCTVELLPAVDSLNCSQDEDAVDLTWENTAPFDSVSIERNGALIASLDGDAVAFRDEGLSPGIYVYRVFGVSGADSGLTSTCSVVIIPSIFSLVCPVTDDAATLSWINGTGYDSIEVFRQAPGEGSASLVATLAGDADAWTDSPLVAVGDYVYTLVGVAAGNRSPSSSCVATRLGAPTGLACSTEDETVSFATVRLTWTNSGSYDSVVVSRNGTTLAVLGGAETSYLDVEVDRGSYEYGVVGVRGNSASPAALCNVNVALPPPPVTNLNCSIADGTASLTWDGLADVFDEIRIYRRRPGKIAALLLTTLPADATSFEDSEATERGTYRYDIVAVRDGLESTRSVCAIENPGIPLDLSCQAANLGATGGDVVLNWSNASTYSSIVVHRADVGQIAVLPGSSSSFTDLGLAPGDYSYSLVAVAAGNTSVATPACDVTITVEPPVIGDLTCVINDSVATLSWTNGAIYDAIAIYRTVGANAEELVEEIDGTGSSYEDSAEEGSTTWRLVGLISGESSESASCTATSPEQPSDLSCIVGERVDGLYSVALSWAVGESVDSLIVVRTRDSDGMTDMVSLRGDQTSFLDSDVEPGLYRYVIIAFVAGSTTSSEACEVDLPDVRGFVRGEINLDGRVDIADPIYCLNFFFHAGPEPSCFDSMDANDDGRLDIADCTYILNWRFRAGPELPAPFPSCGDDPTDDAIDCEDYPSDICPDN